MVLSKAITEKSSRRSQLSYPRNIEKVVSPVLGLLDSEMRRDTIT